MTDKTAMDLLKQARLEALLKAQAAGAVDRMRALDEMKQAANPKASA